MTDLALQTSRQGRQCVSDSFTVFQANKAPSVEDSSVMSACWHRTVIPLSRIVTVCSRIAWIHYYYLSLPHNNKFSKGGLGIQLSGSYLPSMYESQAQSYIYSMSFGRSIGLCEHYYITVQNIFNPFAGKSSFMFLSITLLSSWPHTL